MAASRMAGLPSSFCSGRGPTSRGLRPFLFASGPKLLCSLLATHLSSLDTCPKTPPFRSALFCLAYGVRPLSHEIAFIQGKNDEVNEARAAKEE